MIKTNKITIENLTGGWGSDFFKGTGPSGKQKKLGAYFSGFMNLFHPEYLGHMTAPFGEDPSGLSVTQLAINGAKTSDNKATFITSGGELPEIDLAATWVPSKTNWSAPSGCLDDAFKDIWTHSDTSGVECLLYTWRNGSISYLGYKYSSTPTGRNDVYQTFHKYDKPHVGCLSVLNRSYITDGNYVRYYDPFAATPFPAKENCLNIGLGWTAVSLCDYGNYVAIVGNNGNYSRMWLWDGVGTGSSFQYDIRDSEATAIVNDGGILRVFTKGKNGTTKIKTFSGGAFSEDADWETPTSTCDAPKHNMVDVWLNQIVWRTPDGYLWSFGTPKKSENYYTGAHRIGKITNNSINSYGMVKNLYLQNLYVGMQIGSSSYTVNKVDALSLYASTTTGTLKTNLYELPHKSTIVNINVYFAYCNIINLGEPSPVTIKLYKDGSATDLLNATIPTTKLGKIYHHPFTCSITNVDSFWLDVIPKNGGLTSVKKIEVEYSYNTGNV